MDSPRSDSTAGRPTHRLVVAFLLACAILLGSAGSTLALPPNPVRGKTVSEAARVRDEGVSGRSHGRRVAATARCYPTDPIVCADDPFTD